MKVEKRVILTQEELDAINRAWEILENYHAESIRVDDSQVDIRDKAHDAYEYIDLFLLAYSNVYEEEVK